MSPQEQQAFVSAAMEYVNSNPNILAAHVNYHANIMPQEMMAGTGGTSFLNWHRDYIQAFEDYLVFTGRRNLTPLPEWQPGEPIPQPFWIGIANPNATFDPSLSFSPDFDLQNLGRYRSLEELGNAIMDRHNVVHTEIGGDPSFDFFGFSSPRAPLFWAWHAFIDEIRFDWQRRWMRAPPTPQPGTVPNLLGRSLITARRLLATFGLVLGRAMLAPGAPTNRRLVVVQQNPAPGTAVPPGTSVDVWGGLP